MLLQLNTTGRSRTDDKFFRQNYVDPHPNPNEPCGFGYSICHFKSYGSATKICRLAQHVVRRLVCCEGYLMGLGRAPSTYFWAILMNEEGVERAILELIASGQKKGRGDGFRFHNNGDSEKKGGMIT